MDRLIAALQKVLKARVLRGAAELAVCLLLVAIAAAGLRRAHALNGPFQILDYQAHEPPELIPELGKAIRENFSTETSVLCNFLPDFGPHLAYYAQRDILNNLSEYRFWDPYLNDRSRRIGGVVWLSPDPASQNIVASLPPGQKQFVTVGPHTFCLWKRAEPTQTSASGSLLPPASAPSR